MKEIEELFNTAKEIDYVNAANASRLTREQILEKVVDLIKYRMWHCKRQLERYASSSVRDNQVVVYPNNCGHFSMPVYKQMEEFMENPTWNNLTPLIAEQALRAWFDKNSGFKVQTSDRPLFYALTEILMII